MKNELENGKAPLTSQQIASPLARLAVTLFATFWLTTAAQSSDLEAGIRAYETGDFVTAMEHLAPLAEQGNPAAQTYYGMLYS